MIERTLRLLIAEKEYLIAIDAQQILVSHLGCEVTVVTMAEFSGTLARQDWDVALVDVSEDEESNHLLAREVLGAGAGLVFLTGHSDLAKGVPDFAEWPVVIKPFTDRILVDAVKRALETAGRSLIPS